MPQAADRPGEPLEGKSATACWKMVLDRINDTISARISSGEDLPPPPKTAIAGPEYFGLNVLETVAMLESLDPDKFCRAYWEVCPPISAASPAKPPLWRLLQY